MNAPPQIRVAKEDATGRLFEALLLAFETDPLARWLAPDLAQYRESSPHFMRAFAGRAIDQGSAYYSDNYSGVALWLPPGISPDEEAMGHVMQGYGAHPDLDAAIALFAEMAGYHPDEPHWYLPMIGVVPAQQGAGIGSALMKHALLRCDREHKAAYLESSNPRNNPLYERHGFELLGTIQVGSSPPIFPMLRPAR